MNLCHLFLRFHGLQERSIGLLLFMLSLSISCNTVTLITSPRLIPLNRGDKSPSLETLVVTTVWLQQSLLYPDSKLRVGPNLCLFSCSKDRPLHDELFHDDEEEVDAKSLNWVFHFENSFWLLFKFWQRICLLGSSLCVKSTVLGLVCDKSQAPQVDLELSKYGNFV